MNYFCCTDTRRNAVKHHPVLNGIDFLEVLDNLSDPYNERQTTLFVHFLKPLSTGVPGVTNIIIEGGERIRNIKVVAVNTVIDEAEVLAVKVSKAGDFSTYTLRLVRDHKGDVPPDGFDTELSSVGFSFKVACPSDFDCKPVQQCGTTPVTPPEINYLAKDYAGFRQLMLDRMSLLMPGWKERHAADMGITLVELLAYTADYLSYQQDAIATEAYLDTSRKRISVRRHARLVDYFMHDGCNARAWFHLQVSANVSGRKLLRGEGANTTKILTRQDELPAAFKQDTREYENAINSGAKVFELMHDIELFTKHNEMNFYTWGGKECCLPKGASRATLFGDLSSLKAGDVLILCEVLGPETGVPEDANPAHRHAVRLTEINLLSDMLYAPIGSPPDSSPEINLFPVTEIVWNKADALPFPLCISSHNGTENISVALGNIVMVDHGLTIEDGDESSLLPYIVPVSTMQFAKTDGSCGCGFCEEATNESIPARFYPQLAKAPLTHTGPFNFNDKTLPAASFVKWRMRDTKPAITLTEKAATGDNSSEHQWNPRRDLLNSADNAKEFVVETESDGIAYLRFGDGKHGERPVADKAFFATYRIGNGVSGNTGALSLAHIVIKKNELGEINNIDPVQIDRVWNPLSTSGGMEPETMEEVKQLAPNAFRKQERAVIPSDYEEFTKRCSDDIQHTATTFRWTGSWRTVFLTVDRLGGLDVDEAFEKSLRKGLEPYRMAGFDLEVDSPLEVSLELEMIVCVNANFFASDVKSALLETFSNRILPDGRMGIFHPDNFSFGQPVYLSRFYAAAQAVQGVDSLKITKLVRQGDTNNEFSSPI